MKDKLNNKPILLAGLPRSGTTWIGEIMSQANDVKYVFEPDNEKINAYAWLCKSDIHRFPYIEQSMPQDDFFDLKRLWREAFRGRLGGNFNKRIFTLLFESKVPYIEAGIGEKTGFSYIDCDMKNITHNTWKKPFRKSNQPFRASIARMLLNNPFNTSPNQQIIVKSVHSTLYLDWLAINFSPQIVVILRNPYALFASYLRMKMPDGARNILFQSSIREKVIDDWGINTLPNNGIEGEMAFQIALNFRYIADQFKNSGNNPQLQFLSHDRLCAKPIEMFYELIKNVGLEWSDKIESKIVDSNKSGRGFTAKRLTKDQPSKWKDELTKKEKLTIEFWMREFGLDDFIHSYII